MKVICIWGGPGVGKSTAAAGLFYQMKKAQLNVELVTEYAKDAVWEKRYNILDDQLYIFAKQHRRIARLQAHNIDWVVTDSPIALGLVYQNSTNLGSLFADLVMDVFGKFDNYNFLLSRSHGYNPIGRTQKDLTEATFFDTKVSTLLDRYKVPFTAIPGGEAAVEYIMNEVVIPTASM